MPKLPFDELGVVIFGRQAEEINGQRMDTNVIGRCPFSVNGPAPNKPDSKRIYLGALTEKTHGNAMGVGQLISFTRTSRPTSMRLHRRYASRELIEEARTRDGLRMVEEASPSEFDGQFVAPSLR